MKMNDWNIQFNDLLVTIINTLMVIIFENVSPCLQIPALALEAMDLMSFLQTFLSSPISLHADVIAALRSLMVSVFFNCNHLL